MDDIDFVIPFIEVNEREIDYAAARPPALTDIVRLGADTHFAQNFEPALQDFSRLEVALSSTGPILGDLDVAFFERRSSFSPILELRQRLGYADAFEFDVANVEAAHHGNVDGPFERVEIAFTPDALAGPGRLYLHVAVEGDRRLAMLRLFRHETDFSRTELDLCRASIRESGGGDDAIHVIEKQQSSSANRNEAFRGTTRPLICFLDDDAELADTSTLPILLDRMNAWDAALSGPKLLASQGRLFSGPPYTDPISLETRVAGMGEVDTGEYDMTMLVPWLPSTVLLVRREVMLATGGFDESYLGSQHEDVDFALRARARGFSCLYVGEASAYHHNSMRNGRFRRNKDYLTARWRDREDLFLWTETSDG